MNVELTKGNWQYAIRLRAEILNNIERGTFRYSEYFPGSTRARIFGEAVSKDTMKQRFEAFLRECQLVVDRGNMSPSTLAGYKKIVDELEPEFGSLRAADLTTGHIREWILKLDCTAKTLRNKLSVLRQVLDIAVDDNTISANPMGRLVMEKLIDKVARKSDFEIDPFDAAERAVFLEACLTDAERDQYEFWFETGLRPGELIALAWPKVDWIHGTVRIDANIVERVEKGPKTDAGVRDVELSAKAAAALQRQKARTFLAGGRVWLNPRSGEAWETDAQLRRTSYLHILKKAGIRHRNMYQVRHTFASTQASSGKNLFWLAQQMGHETIEMLVRHYARWIPGMSPDGHVTVTQNRGAKILSMRART